jgi:NAD(P)-dependent dehydrogenase (short-subunit alcohol dehydrogenase family)
VHISNGSNNFLPNTNIPFNLTAKDKNKFNNPFEAIFNGISNLSRKREKSGTLLPTDRLDGKKVLITGSSSGLGLATAKQLAAIGAEVIMAVRSGIPEKGEEVKKTSGSDKVHMLPVDLTDFDSIQHLVKEVKNQFGGIDILIDNAGVVAKNARKTKHGYEEMFSVNYLAKFLFINSMIQEGCLKSAVGSVPRIVIVSSESHRDPKEFQWNDFGVFHDFSMGKSVALYGYLKLMLTTFSVELSRRINSEGKTNFSVFALCPGPVNTNIGREAPTLLRPLMKLIFALFFRSPEKAAEPVVYFAASKEMEGKPYDYFFLMSRKAVDEKAWDSSNGKQLWQLTEELFRKEGILF